MAITTPNMSLKTWDLLTDLFSHTELRSNFVAIDAHDHTTGKGVQVPAGGLANLSVGTAQVQDSAVTTPKINDTAVTGPKIASTSVGDTHLTSSLATVLGATAGATVRRGKSIIATEESRTNVAFGLMTTPDRVQNVVLPTDGLLFIAFSGMVKTSAGGTAGRVAIFIGANQLKADQGNLNPIVDEAIPSGVDTYNHVVTSPSGLFRTAVTYAGDVTTGQVIQAGATGGMGGGVAVVFATAGTYDISLQFKASSGSISAKERKLWVWTAGF